MEGELPNLMRTLLAAGFDVRNVDRKPNYVALSLSRVGAFGIDVSYLLAFAGEGIVSEADVEALKKVSARDHSALVIVARNTNIPEEGCVVIQKSKLFAQMGGIVSSVVPLEPEYGDQLGLLAKNALPAGLVGEPDDLFEAYVYAGLQFLLRGRVLRYGQERRFEAVPDGLIIGSSAPLIMYDAKAAKDPYEITKQTIRQFADYIRQFHIRYEAFIGRLYAFLVVSSAFQDETLLAERSNELYSECSVPLVCLTATSLASMVDLFAHNLTFRSIVDWKSMLVPPMLDPARVKKIVEARQRDKVVAD